MSIKDKLVEMIKFADLPPVEYEITPSRWDKGTISFCLKPYHIVIPDNVLPNYPNLKKLATDSVCVAPTAKSMIEIETTVSVMLARICAHVLQITENIGSIDRETKRWFRENISDYKIRHYGDIQDVMVGLFEFAMIPNPHYENYDIDASKTEQINFIIEKMRNNMTEKYGWKLSERTKIRRRRRR